MKNMFGLLDEIGVQLAEHIKTHVNEPIEMKDTCRKYTTDVIVSAAFGIQSNSLLNEESEFSSVGKQMFTFTFRRSLEMLCIFFVPIFVKNFNFKLLSDTGSQFLRAVISKVMDEREASNVKRPDLIDALITLKNIGTLEDTPVTSGSQKDIVSNGKVLKDEKYDLKLESDVLVAQASIFFTAGFVTTSSAISFTLYSIANYPEVQIKLRTEIQTVIAANDGKFTYECLSEMKYLDFCLKETLRLYPTLGYLDREALDSYTFPGTGVTIEAGTPVIISVSGLHMDPKYFENPEEYDPERYNDENKSKLQSCTYLPIGEGPRNCIGARFGLMSTKIGLVHILKDYEVVTYKNDPPLEIDNKAFLLTAKNGINLKFMSGTVYTK